MALFQFPRWRAHPNTTHARAQLQWASTSCWYLHPQIYDSHVFFFFFFLAIRSSRLMLRSPDDVSHEASPTLTFSFRMRATLMPGWWIRHLQYSQLYYLWKSFGMPVCMSGVHQLGFFLKSWIINETHKESRINSQLQLQDMQML